MTRVYIEEQGMPADLSPSLVFWPNYKFHLKERRLFLRDIMAPYQTPFFDIVSSIEDADFLAVPFEYFDVLDHYAPYLSSVYERAEKAGKKVLLFDYTDYVDRDSRLPAHAVLFRVSVYRHHKKENELVMPYFVEDFGKRFGMAPKKLSSPPIVGYCGYSGLGSMGRKIRALGKRMGQSLKLHLAGDPLVPVHARGIFWRQSALLSLRRAKGITPRIIERTFYSLFKADKVFDPARNRTEYIENMRDSDLSLCTRGDANASQRFYETLSAGRIPLFLDTDCVLPLEEVLPYDHALIRVSWKKVRRLGEEAARFANALTAEDAFARASTAQDLYQSLRLDRYFRRVFDREKSPYADQLWG